MCVATGPFGFCLPVMWVKEATFCSLRERASLTSIEDILVQDESITAVLTAAGVDAETMDVSQSGSTCIKHKRLIHSRTGLTETQPLKTLQACCAEFMTFCQKMKGGE